MIFAWDVGAWFHDGSWSWLPVTHAASAAQSYECGSALSPLDALKTCLFRNFLGVGFFWGGCGFFNLLLFVVLHDRTLLSVYLEKSCIIPVIPLPFNWFPYLDF